jgi:glycosyltransferase involved in cell wall biosynthesis
VLEYPDHRGKGYAVRYGARQTVGDVVVFIDADMELHPDGIGQLVAMVQEGADVAVGSKFHPESRVNYPVFRRAQSRAYQLLVRALFDLDVTDTQTGLKAFRGELLRRVLPSVVSDGFGYDLELLVALHDEGARIVEGPVQLDYAFSTTTSARAAADVLRDTVRLYARRRREKRGRHAAATPR